MIKFDPGIFPGSVFYAMTPQNHILYYSAPFGILTLVAAEGKIRQLLFEKYPPLPGDKIWKNEENCPECLRAAKNFLDQYFAGKKPPSPLTLPLAPQGTVFQKIIWQILLEKLSYGKVMTYGQIALLAAEKRGKAKMSPQAVGNAVGKNPIPLLIPCHRVIASGNRTGGFSSPLYIKKFLLKQEKILFLKGMDEEKSPAEK